MISALKAIFRRTPLYPYRYARQQAPKLREWTQIDSDRVALYSQFVKEGSLVYDVGANIGLHTKAFLRLQARVVAVEPQNICAETLRHAFRDKIVVVESALSNRVGHSDLYSVDGYSVLATLSQKYIATQKAERWPALRWNIKKRIATTTLDRLITQYGIPDFIKIDTEGHDHLVLSGLSHPIRYVSFEVIPECLQEGFACIDKLSSLAHYEFNLSLGDDCGMIWPSWATQATLKDFLPTAGGYANVFARLP